VHAKIVNHVLEHHIHSVTYINPFTKILVLSVSFSVFPNKVEICWRYVTQEKEYFFKKIFIFLLF